MGDVKKSLLEKISDLLERKPEHHDVVFSVGPDKKLVKGVKLILKAASPVFEREFEEKWDCGLAREGEEGIPLPDLDANAFELFIQLTTLDTWGSQTLTNLNLPPNQLLNLLTICTEFGMEQGKTNLQKLVQAFIRSCRESNEDEKLMELSQANFETVLESDDFVLEETKIFEIACRWAMNKCKEQKLEETTENLQKVLGGILFKIRFPLMSNTEFTKAMDFKQLLTMENCFKIYKFIGLEEQQKMNFDTTQFPFNTKKRGLQLLENSVLVSEPLFSSGISTPCHTNGNSAANIPPVICNNRQGLVRSHGKNNDDLVNNLKRNKVIKSREVEYAMRQTDRGIYAPSNPYQDSPQGIGFKTTISAPHMHAYALEVLEKHLFAGARALDVGSGTAYLSVCMALMVGPTGCVVGIDHIPELIAKSKENVERDAPELLKPGRLLLFTSDGRNGWPEKGPYDAIHVGAAAPSIPQPLIDQLKPGGRMVIPVGPKGKDQKLVYQRMLDNIDKLADGRLNRVDLMGVIYGSLQDKEQQLK